jgi:hypothetical protein
MTSAAWALQAAMFAVLTADSGVTALLGGRIYDAPPQRTQFPYLTFAQSSVRDWSTGSDGGEEHTVTFHVWSREGGRREALAVIDAVRGVLHDAALTLAGHRLVNLRHETSDVRRDTSGELFHGIARFRAVTEPHP